MLPSAHEFSVEVLPAKGRGSLQLHENMRP